MRSRDADEAKVEQLLGAVPELCHQRHCGVFLVNLQHHTHYTFAKGSTHAAPGMQRGGGIDGVWVYTWREARDRIYLESQEAV